MAERTRTGTRTFALALTVVVGVAAAVMIAAAVAAGAPAIVPGLPDPGALTRYGLPAVRVVADVSAVLTIGFLLVAAFLVPPQDTGYLDAPGFAAVRRGARAALVWMTAALLMAVLTASEVVGRPVLTLIAEPALLLAIVPEIAASTGWLVTGCVAALVAIGAVVTLTWPWAICLVALSLLGLVPLAASGHSAGSGSHDLAVDSLLLHVGGVALWVGGLVAILAVALQPATRGSLPEALPRFSTLAGWCWMLVAVSGIVNLLVRVPIGEVWLSTYGLLAIAKSASLLALGAVGYLHRQRSVAAAGADAGRVALVRLGGVEVMIMLATVGVGVGLGRTPPPADGPGTLPSSSAEALGYDLAGPPTSLRLLLDWRPDLVMGAVALVLLVGYLGAVRRIGAWPLTRTASWVAGCTVIVLATSSGVGRYAAAMFSVEVAELLLLALVSPLFLAGGAPTVLAAMLGSAGPGSLPWVLDRPAVRWWLRPAVAISVFAGVEVLLLTVGLGVLLPMQFGRLLLELLMLAAGSLVVASVMRARPLRDRQRPAALAVLLVVHAGVAAALYLRSAPIAGEFYRGLALPWAPDLLAGQRWAAAVWLAGVVPITALLALVLKSAGGPRPSPAADSRVTSSPAG